MSASVVAYPPRSAADRPRHPLAFHDPDPLVRVAAVHHLGHVLRDGSLEHQNAAVDQILPLLPRRAADRRWVYPPEYDEFVARYAAVILARGGQDRGLDLLLDLIGDRGDAPDPDLDECLRSCGNYPFAALLNEQIYLGSISDAESKVRTNTHLSLRLTGDMIRHLAEKKPDLRREVFEDVVKIGAAKGIRRRPGREIDRGTVLSPPAGKHPGYAVCPRRGWFFQFHVEAVLNERRHLKAGQDVFFVVDRANPLGAAACVYGLDDPARTLDELDGQVQETLVEGKGNDSPLVPGVVTQFFNRNRQRYAEVLLADGTDQAVLLTGTDLKKVKYGTLALTPQPADGVDTTPLFVRALPPLHRGRVGRIVTEYAKKLGLAKVKVEALDWHGPNQRAVVSSPSRANEKLHFPAGGRNRPGYWLLLRPCQTCGGDGEQACPTCHGDKRSPCVGTVRCTNCVFTGRVRGQPCPRCWGKGERVGCGERGVVTCPKCAGQGLLPCPIQGCKDGMVKCVMCRPGQPCAKCGGNKKHKCPRCKGDTMIVCDSCGEKAEIACPECGGTTRRECVGCNGRGLAGCTKCGRSGWVLAKTVEAFADLLPTQPPPSAKPLNTFAELAAFFKPKP